MKSMEKKKSFGQFSEIFLRFYFLMIFFSKKAFLHIGLLISNWMDDKLIYLNQ